jgi:drug/metabolite transporter (DMT)-like permease
MSAPAIALVLAAALFHAGWNLTLHRAGDRVATVTVNGLVAGVALLPAALLSPPWRVWPLIALSALAETAYALCLSAAYRRGALSIAYPLGRGTSPLLVTLGGWLLLTERPGVLALLGAASLAGGMALLALAGHRFQRADAGRVSTLREVSVLIGILLAGKRLGPRVWLGAVLVVCGALLAAA